MTSYLLRNVKEELAHDIEVLGVLQTWRCQLMIETAGEEPKGVGPNFSVYRLSKA